MGWFEPAGGEQLCNNSATCKARLSPWHSTIGFGEWHRLVQTAISCRTAYFEYSIQLVSCKEPPYRRLKVQPLQALLPCAVSGDRSFQQQTEWQLTRIMGAYAVPLRSGCSQQLFDGNTTSCMVRAAVTAADVSGACSHHIWVIQMVSASHPWSCPQQAASNSM